MSYTLNCKRRVILFCAVLSSAVVKGKKRGTWLAQLVEHVTLGLRIVSSFEPHVGFNDYLKSLKRTTTKGKKS